MTKYWGLRYIAVRYFAVPLYLYFVRYGLKKRYTELLKLKTISDPCIFFFLLWASDAHVTSYVPSTKRGRGGTLLRIVYIAAGQNPEKHILYCCYVYMYFDYLLITGLYQLFLCVHLIVFF